MSWCYSRSGQTKAQGYLIYTFCFEIIIQDILMYDYTYLICIYIGLGVKACGSIGLVSVQVI